MYTIERLTDTSVIIAQPTGEGMWRRALSNSAKDREGLSAILGTDSVEYKQVMDEWGPEPTVLPEPSPSPSAEEMADQVRQQRDALLAESDRHMTLDNIGLQIPDKISTIASVADVIAGFAAAVSGPWATYRQALRDIPKQPGFPRTVEWPAKPEA